MKDKTLIAIHSVSLGNEVPSSIHILPNGKFDGRDGRGPYVASDLKKIVETTNHLSRGVDIAIDYEHQFDYASLNGKPAPAGGWIKSLEIKEDGIWGNVEWTEAAHKMIAQKEYRYLSPVFRFFPKSGEIHSIRGASLTNNPNLLLTSLNSMEESESMDPKLGSQLATVLGLPDTAKDEQIVSAVSKVLSESKHSAENLGKVAKALKLDEKADVETVLASIKPVATNPHATNDPTKFVPFEKFNEIATALNSLQTEVAVQKATDAVNSAMKEGKITPALKDWAISMHKADPVKFAEFIKNQPVIAGTSEQTAKHSAVSKLDDTQIAICKQLNVSEEDYLKELNKEVN
jgi:phage I-like protein